MGKRSTTRKPSTFNQTSLSSWQKGGNLSSWQIWLRRNEPINLKFYETFPTKQACRADKDGSEKKEPTKPQILRSTLPCWQRWLHNSALNQSNPMEGRGPPLFRIELKDNYQTIEGFGGPALHTMSRCQSIVVPLVSVGGQFGNTSQVNNGRQRRGKKRSR